MKNLNLLFKLFCILLATVSSSLSAEGNIPRLFEENMCLGVKFAQGQPLHDLEMLKELKVRWVRDTIPWSYVEPRPGHYKPFPDSLKTRLSFYQKNNIGVIFLVGLENNIAYSNSPERPHNFVNAYAFGRYAAHMARELKSSGVNFVIELWNEPHNSRFAKKEHLGGVWNGRPPSPWVDQYVEMVNQAVKRVKAIDPKIKVITDDDMWIVHYFFLDKGLPSQLDGFAVHPYSQTPELAAVKYDTDWTQPYHVVDKDQSFESAVRRLKEHGLSKMGKVPEIWITEWGWRVGEKSPFGPISEARIAQYLPRAMILAAAANTETACWFSSMDGPDGEFGLKTNQGRVRPAFNAYKTLADHLGKTSYVCELKPASLEASKRSFIFKQTTPVNGLPKVVEDHFVIASWDTKSQSFYDQSVVYEKVVGINLARECKPSVNVIGVE